MTPGPGSFSTTTSTKVELSGKNYKIIKANAVGRSWGCNLLLGLINMVEPRYDAAMADLYKNAGIEEGKAIALINVTQQKSNCNLLFISTPKITISADIIEFTN